MTTVHGAIDGLVTALIPAVTGLTADGKAFTVDIAHGWPSENTVQDCTRDQRALVVLNNRLSRKSAKNWLPRDVLEVTESPGIQTTLSTTRLLSLGTATVTLSYADGSTAVKENDAATLMIWSDPYGNEGAVAIAETDETLSTMAAKLAAAINAESGLNTKMSASANGAAVTLTGLVEGVAFELGSSCGNIGTLYREVGRGYTQVQIACLARTVSMVHAIANSVEVAIHSMEADYGFQLANSEGVRLEYVGSGSNPNNTRGDIYETDYIVDLDFSVIKAETVYSYLTPLVRELDEPE